MESINFYPLSPLHRKFTQPQTNNSPGFVLFVCKPGMGPWEGGWKRTEHNQYIQLLAHTECSAVNKGREGTVNLALISYRH